MRATSVIVMVNFSKFFDTLLLKILWTFIKIRASSFIKKRKSKKVPWKLSLSKKCNRAFRRTFHHNRWYFTCCYTFFFSQTNLVFKSNPVFIDILNYYCHNLFTFFSFHFLSSTESDAHPVPLCVFCKNQ